MSDEYNPFEGMALDFERGDDAYLQVDQRDLVHVADFDAEKGTVRVVVWASTHSDSAIAWQGEVDATAHRARIKFEQTYSDGRDSEHTLWVDAPEDDQDIDDWWDDVVFPHTGDGTGENLTGFYEATVLTCVSQPDLVGEKREWDG